ncbi:MAG: CarD family transcriptional regulator, partial [Desulfobacterales bacterium]
MNRLSERDRRIECFGISGSEKAYLISKIFNQKRDSVFVIVDTLEEGRQVFEDLKFFCDNVDESILFFPPYNILPSKFLSYHNETAAHRISILYRLMEATTPRVVVTTVDALLQKTIPKEEIIRYVDLILTGEEIDRERFIAKLISGGYTKSAIVEEPGDFSVRGGIIDVYSPLYPDPLRIEFFGDLVESLRFFSVSNQRKIRDIDEAVILPAKEVIFTQSELPQIISRIRAQASTLDLPVGVVRSIVEYLKNSENFPGVESLISLIYPELDTLFDYIPQNSLMVVINPDALKKSATELEERLNDHYISLRDEKKLCVEPQELYLNWSEAETFIDKKKPLVFKMLDVFKPKEYQESPPFLFKATVEKNTDLSLKLKQPQSKKHLLRPLVEWLAEKMEFGYTAIVSCQTRSQADRLHALLTPYMVEIEIVDNIPPRDTNQQRIYVCIGRLSAGFVWPEESLAIITDDEIFGVQHHRRKRLRPKPSASLLDLQELKKDDLIVHDDHGIGQYGGLAKLNIGGITNDFVIIIYKGGDK